MARWLLTLFLGLGLALPAQADVVAQIDHRRGTLDDQFVLTVTVDGDIQTRPALPPLDTFDVFSRGQSTRVSIINGRQAVALEFTYVLVPKATGVFSVGPITAQVGGEQQASAPFTIEVLEQAAQPAAERTLFATATVSDTTPYVGEPIVYTFRFYHRVRVNGGNLENPPFDGFTVHPLGDQREYETTLDGQGFVVVEFEKALIPQRVGTIEIPATALQIDVLVQSQGRSRGIFGMFGGYQTESKTVRTEPVTVQVRPLPPAPPDFSGLVGDFTLTAQLSRTELAAGESTTLEATVRGTGNAFVIPEPKLGELNGFKVYDDKPTSGTDTDGNKLRGWRTFRKSLVPLAAGQPTVGPVRLVWFDPVREAYRTATQGPFTLNVAPPPEGEDLNLTEGLLPGTGKVAVRVIGDDIVPIYRQLDALPSLDPSAKQGLLGGALLFPPLGFGALEILRRRRERWGGDAALRRRTGARKKANRALGEARGISDPARAAEALSRALRGFIGDKLDREGGALTPAEARAALEGAGIEQALAAEVEQRLQWAEALRYGGAQGGPSGEVAAAFAALVDRLDRGLR